MRKRIALVLLFVLLVVFGFVYFSRPKNLSIRKRTLIAVNAKAFSRVFFGTENWRRWWPTEGAILSPLHFRYNGADYRILEKRYSSLLFSIKKDDDSLTAELLTIPLRADSVEVSWTGKAKTQETAFSNRRTSQWVRGLNTDLGTILQKAKLFLYKQNNLYGIALKKELVVDSLLVSTSLDSKTYPTTETVYGLVNKLKAYAQQNNGQQTGLPMLNVTQRAGGYTTKVAVPVDRQLQNAGDVQFRRMLGGGKILVTEIKGGPAQVEKAFLEIENYLNDNNLVTPAIPFQSLVTDRSREKDTTKWVTKVYWPVM